MGFELWAEKEEGSSEKIEGIEFRLIRMYLQSNSIFFQSLINLFLACAVKKEPFSPSFIKD